MSGSSDAVASSKDEPLYERTPGHEFAFVGVERRFQQGAVDVLALRDLDFSVKRGEFVALLGPSGCGKSTALNMVAGLLPPTKGRVLYRGNQVPMPNTSVGYITQSDNLLPWRTVAENVSLGLELRGVPREERSTRIAAVLELVGLEGFETAYPSQLSGGMRKRCALARTLVYEPDSILADEPFGALDAQLKVQMQAELLRIWQMDDNRSVLFVTHDLSEAITLADRVLVFSSRPGRIKVDCSVDIDRPRDAYSVRFTEEFAELHQRLWSAIRDDIGDDGEDFG